MMGDNTYFIECDVIENDEPFLISEKEKMEREIEKRENEWGEGRGGEREREREGRDYVGLIHSRV